MRGQEVSEWSQVSVVCVLHIGQVSSYEHGYKSALMKRFLPFAEEKQLALLNG